VPAAKLPFGDIVGESFGFFFANLSLFFHLVTVPWILSLVLRIVGSAIGTESMLVVLAEKALDALPTVMFTVVWMRVVLLGAPRAGGPPGLSWSARESAFLVHLLQVAGITFVLIAAFILTVGPLDPSMLSGGGASDPELARRESTAAPLGIGFMVSAILALRVSFGLAATAVDLPFTPRLSWAYSRGNSWTIIGALFVIFFANAIVTMMAALVPLAMIRGLLGANSAAALVAWAAATLVSYGGVAVAATAQAIIFRRLTGWREGVPLAPPS